MTGDIFGNVTAVQQLENAVIATLDAWFETYMKEYELQAGLITDPTQDLHHPLPKSYLRADQLDRAAADALPTIVVVSPGLSGRSVPMMEGDGSYRVPFSIAVGVFVGTEERNNTMNLARVYTAVVRTIMLQKQSFGGFADGSTWLDESYDDNFPFTDNQTISAGQVVFEVEVAGVVTRFTGPVGTPSPTTQPGSEWPLADLVTVQISVKED